MLSVSAGPSRSFAASCPQPSPVLARGWLYTAQLMPAVTLPDTKILTFFSAPAPAGSKAAPIPFTQAELLRFPEVKQWLAKGYELESFENKLSPKDPSQVILLVVLVRVA